MPQLDEFVVDPQSLGLLERLEKLENEFAAYRAKTERIHILEINGPVSQDPAENYQPYQFAPSLTQFALPFTIKHHINVKRIFVPTANGDVSSATLRMAMAIYKMVNPDDVSDALVTTTFGPVPIQLRKVAEFLPRESVLPIASGGDDLFIADLEREAPLSPGTYAIVYHSDTTEVAFKATPSYFDHYRRPFTLTTPAGFVGDFPPVLDSNGAFQYQTVGPYVLLRSRIGVHIRPNALDRFLDD